MPKLITVVLPLILALAASATQAASTWKIHAGSNVIYQQLREETLHPLRNQGAALSLSTGVSRQTPANLISARFHIPLGVLFDRYAYPAISIQYGLETHGLWHLNQTYSVGYMLSGNARYRYFPEWDDSHLYWLTDYTLGPAFAYRYPQNPKWSAYTEFGLLSLVSRSPQRPLSKFDNILNVSGFFSVPHGDMQFKHIGTFQTVRLQLNYDPGKRGAHLWHYEFRLSRTEEIRNFVEIWHGIGWRYAF